MINVRPILRPGLRVLQRDAETVQISPGAEPTLVIEDCRELRAVLGALDGVRDEAAVVAAARGRHVSARGAASTLAALQDLGVITDADDLCEASRILPTSPRHIALADVGAVGAGAQDTPASQVIRRRRRARIDVVGLGAVGAHLAWLLAASGVGVLTLIDPTPVPPTPSVGWLTPRSGKATRQGSVRETLATAIPWTTLAVGRQPDKPDLAVVAPDPQLGTSRPDPVEIDALARSGAPHLIVTVDATHAEVGPLVVPGCSPCLRCLDLTNADSDSAWPLLVHQLSTPASADNARWAAVDPMLVALAGAYAAGQALGFIQGFAVSTTHQVTRLDREGSQSAQPSRAHPGCGCSWDRPATMGA